MATDTGEAKAPAVEVARFQEFLQAFARAREWEQYHTPKNLAMALTVEAAELQEIFQWLTPDEATSVMADPKQAEAVRDELADVFVYTVRLAHVLGVDLSEALAAKMAKNAAKYPVNLAKGRATKYTDL